MHSSLARICDFFLSMLVATVLWMAPGLAATTCNFPPGYYRVVNTEPGEDLQLRSDPSSSSMLMGTLHDDEIVFTDGTRGMANVIYADAAAWIAHHDIAMGWPEMAALRAAARLEGFTLLGPVTDGIRTWMADHGLRADIAEMPVFAGGFQRD